MLVSIEFDDDVFESATERAAHLGTDVGRVLSDPARASLAAMSGRTRNGVPLLPSRPAGCSRPTMRLVNRLRDGA